MICTQNPSEDANRKVLPQGLLQKSVVIETPDYNLD